MNKSVLLILSVIFTLILMISSCSDKLNEPGFPGLRCDINSYEFIADTAYYTYGPGINIYAYKGNAELQFHLNSLTTKDSVGSYSLDTSGLTSSALYFDGTGTTYQSISGTVNMTQFYNVSLKICSGNFSFTGRVPGSSGNTVTIQYGYFNNIPRH